MNASGEMADWIPNPDYADLGSGVAPYPVMGPGLKAFVINMVRRPDRRAHVATLCRELHLDFEFIDAVDGHALSQLAGSTIEVVPSQRQVSQNTQTRTAKTLPCDTSSARGFSNLCVKTYRARWCEGGAEKEQLLRMSAHRLRSSELTQHGHELWGAVGCSLSHQAVLRRVLSDPGLEWALILEDDATLTGTGTQTCETFNQEMAHLNVKYPNWALVYLGGHISTRIKNKDRYASKLTNRLCLSSQVYQTHAFVVRRALIPVILERLKDGFAADAALVSWSRSTPERTFLFVPQLVVQPGGARRWKDSDIFVEGEFFKRDAAKLCDGVYKFSGQRARVTDTSMSIQRGVREDGRRGWHLALLRPRKTCLPLSRRAAPASRSRRASVNPRIWAKEILMKSERVIQDDRLIFLGIPGKVRATLLSTLSTALGLSAPKSNVATTPSANPIIAAPASKALPFEIGQLVEMRDRGRPWIKGYVTQLDPLKVKVHADKESYCWDEVRHVQKDYVVGQRVERRDNGKEWLCGYVTSIDPLKVSARDYLGAPGYGWEEVRPIKVPEAAEAKTSRKSHRRKPIVADTETLALLGRVLHTAEEGLRATIQDLTGTLSSRCSFHGAGWLCQVSQIARGLEDGSGLTISSEDRTHLEGLVHCVKEHAPGAQSKEELLNAMREAASAKANDTIESENDSNDFPEMLDPPAETHQVPWPPMPQAIVLMGLQTLVSDYKNRLQDVLDAINLLEKFLAAVAPKTSNPEHGTKPATASATPVSHKEKVSALRAAMAQSSAFEAVSAFQRFGQIGSGTTAQPSRAQASSGRCTVHQGRSAAPARTSVKPAKQMSQNLGTARVDPAALVRGKKRQKLDEMSVSDLRKKARYDGVNPVVLRGCLEKEDLVNALMDLEP